MIMLNTGLRRIREVLAGDVITGRRKHYSFGEKDPILEHAVPGGYLKVEFVNRGFDRFTVYNPERVEVYKGERMVALAIA